MSVLPKSSWASHMSCWHSTTSTIHCNYSNYTNQEYFNYIHHESNLQTPKTRIFWTLTKDQRPPSSQRCAVLPVPSCYVLSYCLATPIDSTWTIQDDWPFTDQRPHPELHLDQALGQATVTGQSWSCHSQPHDPYHESLLAKGTAAPLSTTVMSQGDSSTPLSITVTSRGDNSTPLHYCHEPRGQQHPSPPLGL